MDQGSLHDLGMGVFSVIEGRGYALESVISKGVYNVTHIMY